MLLSRNLFTTGKAMYGVKLVIDFGREENIFASLDNPSLVYFSSQLEAEASSQSYVTGVTITGIKIPVLYPNSTR